MRRIKATRRLMFVVMGFIFLTLIFHLHFRLPDYKTTEEECFNQVRLRGERDDHINMAHRLPNDLPGDHDQNKSFSMTNPTDKMQNSPHRTNQLWTKPSKEELEKALVLGSKRNLSGFLTIGIPTVQRETEHYLTQTLDSLISNSSPNERSDVILLIFLADLEEEKRSILKEIIKDKYIHFLKNGLIQVIEAPASFYPPLKNLKSNYGDSETRVRWRSKQCADFAFMFFYAENLSEYYLQIEDDVFTSGGYLTSIRLYIQEKNNVKWASLEFSTMGFIGKLFHTYDLDRLAQFTMIFYQDQPVDWLFRYFKDLNAQHKNYVRAPSLFQHRGFQSSLKGKNTANWEDKTFDPDQPQYVDADNPSGKVYSNMTAYDKHLPQLSYNKSSNFFWAKKPRKDDVVVLIFDKPTVISRLAIVTGSPEHPADTLKEAAVELSSGLLPTGSANVLPKCSSFKEVGRFFNGCIDVDVHETFPSEVACLRIVVYQSQEQWAIIKEIAVWISH